MRRCKGARLGRNEKTCQTRWPTQLTTGQFVAGTYFIK